MIDLDSEGITKITSLKLDSGPHKIVVNEKSNLIYVLNWGGTVTVIDGCNNRILDRILVPGVDDICIDSKSNRLSVLRYQTISIIDVGTGSSLDQGDVFSIAVRSGGGNMALDYARNLIYLIHKDYKSVNVIDIESRRMIKSIPIKKGAVDIKMDQKTNLIYVAIHSPATLIIIDGYENKIIKEIDLHVKESIWHMTKQHYLRQIYLNSSIGRLYVLYKQSFFISSPCYGGGHTEYQDGIMIFDLSNWKLLEDQKLKIGLNQLCINKKNNKIYCANSRYKEIEVLNEDGYSEFQSISIDGGTYDIAINPTTHKLYVAISRLLRRSLLGVYDVHTEDTLEYQVPRTEGNSRLHKY